MKLKCCIWSTSQRRRRTPVPPPPQTLHYTEIVLIHVHMFQFLLINNHHIFISNTLVSAPRNDLERARARAHTLNEKQFSKTKKKVSPAINNRQSIGILQWKQWTTKNKNIERKIYGLTSSQTAAENENGTAAPTKNTKLHTHFSHICNNARNLLRHQAICKHTSEASVTPYCCLLAAHSRNCIRALHSKVYGAKYHIFRCRTRRVERRCRHGRLRPLSKIASRK